MNPCPNCSHTLLSHIRSHSRYWYCQHCRLEMSNVFISAKNNKSLHKSVLLSKCKGKVPSNY